LAHYFLHREIPRPEHFSSLQLFKQWSGTHGGNKYDLEQEANEFAGLLLVPTDTLAELYDKFAQGIEGHLPNFRESNDIRDKFADNVASKFGVNAPVIAVRLDRDAIWPAS
jgi:Zn-dependent peptidase ImmA (M78 family)